MRCSILGQARPAESSLPGLVPVVSLLLLLLLCPALSAHPVSGVQEALLPDLPGAALPALDLPASPATGNSITNISFNPASPASLAVSSHVNVTFTYSTTDTAGVLIWIWPCGNTNTLFSSSPVYAYPGGTGNAWFTSTQPQTFTSLCATMQDLAQTVTYVNNHMTVNFTFGSPSTNSVTNIVFTPSSPATVAVNSHVNVTFHYTTTDTAGVLVWIEPFGTNINSSGSPHYAYPNGNGNEWFTATQATTVTTVHVIMKNLSQTITYIDQTVTVHFTFGSSPPPAGCQPNTTTLCIDDAPGDARYAVQVHYQSTQGGGVSGNAHAISLSSLGVHNGGLFWFFSQNNPELLIKVLNACSGGGNGYHWLFCSAGTNVGVTVTVTDTETGAQEIYSNPDLQPMESIQDVTAFPCP